MDAGTLTTDFASDPKALHRSQVFAQTLVHLTSLLHAVALQHLRSDWELANLTPYTVTDPPPPMVSYPVQYLQAQDSHTARVLRPRLLAGLAAWPNLLLRLAKLIVPL